MISVSRIRSIDRSIEKKKKHPCHKNNTMNGDTKRFDRLSKKKKEKRKREKERKERRSKNEVLNEKKNIL